MSDDVAYAESVNALLDSMAESYLTPEAMAEVAVEDNRRKRSALGKADLEYGLAVELLQDALDKAPTCMSVEDAKAKKAERQKQWTQARKALLGY